MLTRRRLRETRLADKLAIALIASLLASGCDSSFEPIAESNRKFSIFGYLDPAADTQWIRVMPTRAVILTSPEPLGTTVTLEEEGTGRTIVLRDSVFHYEDDTSELVQSEGLFVHNFWTTERIRPGATYRFTATAADGAISSATVAIPPELSVSVTLQQRSTSPSAIDELRVAGPQHLAFVRVMNHYRDDCPPTPNPQSLIYEIPEGSTNPHVVPVSKLFGRPNPACLRINIVDWREIWIVGTESPWPAIETVAPPWYPPAAAAAISEVPTNLTNGVGYLGGVIIKAVPYENCQIVGPAPIPENCVLSYDSQKAMVSGTITESCGNRPLADAVVRLEPVLADPAGHRKIRTAQGSSLAGAYRVAALDPNIRYALRVSHPAPNPEDHNLSLNYAVHTDTLELRPGEQLALNVRLQRLSTC